MLNLSSPLKAAQVGWDAQSSLGGTYPPSIALDNKLGVYWAFRSLQLSPSLKKYSYGYLRPNLRYVTSGLSHRGAIRLDIFPISFLGGTIGYSQTQTNLDGLSSFEEWSEYNCNEVDCEDQISRYFWEAKLRWKIAKLGGIFFYRQDWIQSDSSLGRSFDPQSTLAFESSEDESQHLWFIAGLNLKPHFLGIRYRYLNWKRSGEDLSAYSLIGQARFSKIFKLQMEGGYRPRRNETLFFSVRFVFDFKANPEPHF